MREKNKLYLGFMDLQQAYDRVNREALWQVLVIYGVGFRLLNGIKSMYDDSEACVRINGVNGDWFRINSGVRQGCVMSPWLFNLYMDGVMKEFEVGMAGNGVRMMENRDEWRVPYLLYADDLVLCGESEESLRGLVERFGRVLSLIHISEPTRLLSISYAVFCLKKKKKRKKYLKYVYKMK